MLRTPSEVIVLFSTVTVLCIANAKELSIKEYLNNEIFSFVLPKSYRSMRDLTPTDFDRRLAEEYVKEGSLDFKELAIKHGYPIEEHIVVSKDGYILTVFRIPHGKNFNTIGPPVIMMHGVTDSADTWIFPGPGYGLGYLVVDAMYDVWFPNYRGNKYSRKHMFLDPDKDKKFWTFSYDEMAVNDLPVIIDYILQIRKVTRVSYVGFSQGTTIFFAMSAHNPEYYSKVNIMVALAPVSWLTKLRNPHIRRVTRVLPRAHAFLKSLGIVEILSTNSLFASSLGVVCKDRRSNLTVVCRDLLFEVFGPDEEQFRYELIPTIYGHTPAGASVHNVVHLGQGVRNKRFQRFDWGSKRNLEVYGQTVPPEYNVSSISTPVAMMYGINDWLTSPVDIAKLRKRLPNVVDNFVVPRKRWQHSDHVWGREAPELIGVRTIKWLDTYNKIYVAGA